jgi:ketosteroid isomerase-like protein
MNAVPDVKVNPTAVPKSESVQHAAAAAPASAQSPSNNATELVQAFTAAFTSDDVESFYKLIAPEGEWVIMATGETFRGLDQIKQLTARSVAARTHGGGLGIKPTNIFTNAEGSILCWEYVHTGVVTDKWPASSSQRPAPGTTFKLPIILVGEIREGKIIKMREYFDLLTLTEAGTPHHLYS